MLGYVARSGAPAHCLRRTGARIRTTPPRIAMQTRPRRWTSHASLQYVVRSGMVSRTASPTGAALWESWAPVEMPAAETPWWPMPCACIARSPRPSARTAISVAMRRIDGRFAGAGRADRDEPVQKDVSLRALPTGVVTCRHSAMRSGTPWNEGGGRPPPASPVGQRVAAAGRGHRRSRRATGAEPRTRVPNVLDVTACPSEAVGTQAWVRVGQYDRRCPLLPRGPGPTRRDVMTSRYPPIPIRLPKGDR